MTYLPFHTNRYLPGLITLALVLVTSGAAAQETGRDQATSLAELAGQETARREAIAEEARARVHTNADLRESGGLTVASAPRDAAERADPEAGNGGPAAEDTAGGDTAEAAASAGAPRDEAYWRNRIAEAEASRARAALMADALQNRADGLWTQFTAIDDPARQRVVERQRNDALAALETARVELEAAERTIGQIREEARRAGVPPGWLR